MALFPAWIDGEGGVQMAERAGGRGCTGFLVVVALFLPVGCSRQPDVIIDYCARPPASVSEPRVAAILAAAQGRHVMEGTWRNGRQETVLTLDFAGGEQLPSGTMCGDALRVAVTAHAQTRDGLIHADGTLLRFEDQIGAGTLAIPVDDLPDAYLHPSEDPSLGSLGFASEPMEVPMATPSTLFVALSRDLIDVLLVDNHNLTLARWSSEGETIPLRRPAPYEVPPDLAGDCAPAASYTGAHDQYTSFASARDAALAMSGRWLRCRDAGGPPHAGMEIGTDGTWRHLMWDGVALTARGGLEHEGFIETPIDTSLANNRSGFFQIGLRSRSWGRSGFLWNDQMIMFAFDSEQPVVYLRTDRIVTPAAPVPYAARERAGAPSCATAEAGYLDLRADETNAMLAGRWTLCSGDLLQPVNALEFDGRGGVHLIDASGADLKFATYRAVNPVTMPATTYLQTALVFDDLATWMIILSERPLKLWMLTPASSRLARHATFAAESAPIR